MGIDGLVKKLPEKLKKYMPAILLALLGIVLLLRPEEPETAEVQPAAVTVTVEEESTEKRLQRILSQVDGAGRVQVMLTVKNNGSTVFQTDTEESRGASETEVKTRTVFYRNGEEALVQSTAMPEYLGAVVVCDGAERAEVRLRLVRAVCSLTGLTGNKISILKMKS